MEILGVIILNFIVPFVMILVGAILKKYPVSDMKSSNGYNTAASRKSQAHWDFAQQIAPGIFIRFGTALSIAALALSAAEILMKTKFWFSFIPGIIMGGLFLLMAFLYTEYRIKEEFPSR